MKFLERDLIPTVLLTRHVRSDLAGGIFEPETKMGKGG